MIKKLFILSLFLLTSISLCLASEQIIFGGSGGDPIATEYSDIIGQSIGAAAWVSNIKDTQGIISAAGVLSDFYIKLNTAPGSGESRTFTIMIDEVASSMTVTFSNTDTEKSDTVNDLNISVGKRITLRATESSIGASDPINISWSFKWTPTTTDETIIVGGTSGTEEFYHSLYGTSGAEVTEFDRSFIVPTNGTIKKLYVWQEIAPSGTTSLWTIRKDGSPTSVTAEIADGATTANSGANSFSVTAGETLSIITTSLGSGGAAWGCIFVPDNAGEFIIAATTDDRVIIGTEYHNISAADGRWTSTENIRNTGGGECTIKKLYVKSESAVGTGDTLVFTLRINGADSSPLLSKTLSQTESSGNVSQDVSVANNDLLSMEMVASEQSTIKFSLLGFILPPPPPPTKIQGATLQGATIN